VSIISIIKTIYQKGFNNDIERQVLSPQSNLQLQSAFGQDNLKSRMTREQLYKKIENLEENITKSNNPQDKNFFSTMIGLFFNFPPVYLALSIFLTGGTVVGLGLVYIGGSLYIKKTFGR